MPAQHQRERDIPAALPKPAERQRNYKMKPTEKKKNHKEKNPSTEKRQTHGLQHTLLSSISEFCIWGATHSAWPNAFQQGEQSEIWLHKQFLGRGWERGQAGIMELGHKSPESFLDLCRVRTIQLLSSSGEKAKSWTCQSNEALAFYGSPSVPTLQLKIRGNVRIKKEHQHESSKEHYSTCSPISIWNT